MRRGPVLALAAAACAACACGATLRDARPLVVWNVTRSAPLGPYLVAPPRAPRRGDLVLVRPEPAIAAWLAASGRLAPGAPLIKRVAAVAPQSVCRRRAEIVIDGRPVARARWRDSAGAALPAWSGCARLAGGDVFLLSSHPDSIDGRYLGPTPAAAVIGRARPIRLGGAR